MYGLAILECVRRKLSGAIWDNKGNGPVHTLEIEGGVCPQHAFDTPLLEDRQDCSLTSNAAVCQGG